MLFTVLLRRRIVLALLTTLAAGCLPPPDAIDAGDAANAADTMDTGNAADARPDSVDAADAPEDAPLGPPWCSLGADVPGALVPPEFCVRRYAGIDSARVLAFAPNGDLFVAAPSRDAAGGAVGVLGAIMVLSDDDRDGVAEVHRFAEGIPDVHGLAIGGGYVYWTTQTDVFRTPYAPGQRAASGPRESLGAPPSFGTGGRWTHGLARSVGGVLFASRGEYSSCGTPGSGEIDQVAPGPFTQISTGFRNPMYLRCHFRDELCMASELGEDVTPGAREKLLVIRPGTNYGYPCCFTTNAPSRADAGSCASVVAEEESMPVGDTPFGLDWERGLWPSPWRDGLFVALHGSFYTSPAWQGAGVVFYATDPSTHVPRGERTLFLGGFGPGGSPLERPADVAFAPDGRMFVADDHGDAVYWIAPTTLRMRAR